MLQLAAIFAVALTPSLLWLWYFWSREHNREEARPLARAFFWGMFSFIPAVIAEVGILGVNGHERMATSWMGIALLTIFVVGPVEEICKFWATRRALRDEPAFDEPADGIIYAASAALGFAFVENIFYLADLNPVLIVMRSLLAVPGHVLFAAWWGAALGRHHFIPGTPLSSVYRGLLGAALMHGLYDAFAIGSGLWGGALICLLITVWVMWRSYRGMMAEALAHVAPGAVGKEPHPDRPAPSPVPAPPPVYGPEIRWFWVLASTVLGVLMTGISLFVVGFYMAARDPAAAQAGSIEPGAATLFIASVLGLTLGGILSAYLSPGRTVRETSLGLGFLGALIGVSSGPLGSFLFMIPFALLGAFGGWLGEAISEPAATHSTAVPAASHVSPT